jgi:AraC-like DNA-binding protein
MKNSNEYYNIPPLSTISDRRLATAVSRLIVLKMPSTEPITATGRPRIVFHFGSPPSEVIETDGSRAMVSRMDLLGQKTSAGSYSSAASNVDSYVIEICPLMLRRLFPDIPAWTLTNRRIPVRSYLPEARDLFDCLSSADPANRPSIANAWIEEFWRDNAYTLVVAAIDAIFAAGGMVSPKTLAKDLGVSMRMLQLVFRDEIGISPKLMCSQIRCQLAAQLCSPDSKNSWVATDCNYFDQPHMNRDFKRFLGMTPIQAAKTGYRSVRVEQMSTV